MSQTLTSASLPRLSVAGGWETLFEDPARQALERKVLPSYLGNQRWFGGKARGLARVRVLDWGRLPAGPAQSFLVFLEIEYTDHQSDLYFVPLGVTSGQAASGLLQSNPAHVLGCLAGPDGEAILHDAPADDHACVALLDSIAEQRVLPTRAGTIRAIPTSAFRSLRGPADGPLPVSRGPATSSNSLIFYEKRLLLKVFRRSEVGINPDCEVGRYLTEHTGFDRIPKVAGAVEYHRAGAEPITLAILQQYVANQGDGWRHALDELGQYFECFRERVAAPPDDRPLLELADAAPPVEIREAIGSSYQAATTLGRRTAQMHLALAADASDPAFAPEPLTSADVAAVRADIRARGRRELDALETMVGPVEVNRLQPKRMLEQWALGNERWAALSAAPLGAKIRVHGDYHLGQVLWVDNDYVIIDFEGEPTRTIAQRRAKQSPLRDVAGMLRSYDYAAHAGLIAFSRKYQVDSDQLELWARQWQQWTSAAFLREYRATAAGAVFLPADRSALAALLDAFLLAKALYELDYEMNNRPDWIRIPMCGILALLGRKT
jgi:maltose alpha-D-glucosyltransferase/alpha-amylase